MTADYPQFLIEMRDILAGELKPWVVDLSVIENAVERFRETYKGETLYIPKNMLLEKAQRNLKITQEFNGINHAELAHKYDVTERHVYRILEKHDKKQIDWCDEK